MAIERLTAGLGYERTATASVVLADDEPILRIRRDRTRARVDLVLLDGQRTVEVSFHPSAAGGVVRERARRAGADPNGWSGALARAVGEDAAAWGLAAVDGGDLLRVLGAAAHPVLAEAYAAGAATVEEVPRWAAPALQATTVAAAAAVLFGPRSATRAVVRATAATLAALPATWWNLALAAGAAAVVEPDDVVRSLEAPVPSSAEPPTIDDLRTIADGLRLVGGDRARRLVAEAATAGSAAALVATLRLLLDVQRDVRWPLPSTRGALERVCLLAAAIDPDPGPRRLPPHPVRPEAAAPGVPRPHRRLVQPTVPAAETTAGAVAAVAAAFPGSQPVAPARVAAPARPTYSVARRAPEVRAAAPPADGIFRHGEVARALAADGVAGRYDLVLPRSGAELATWGRLLGNCLGDFSAAVAAGATIVVGVREEGLLVAAAELRGRQLLQLLGARNRPVPRTLAVAVEVHVDTVLGRRRRRPSPGPS